MKRNFLKIHQNKTFGSSAKVTLYYDVKGGNTEEKLSRRRGVHQTKIVWLDDEAYSKKATFLCKNVAKFHLLSVADDRRGKHNKATWAGERVEKKYKGHNIFREKYV